MGREGITDNGNSRPGGAATGPARNALPPGTRLHEFEIERVLGEGGFGVVYLAFDHSLERHVALKEYLPGAFACRLDAMTIGPRSDQHRDTYASGLKSFMQEARMLAQFEHPAMVKVLRFWEGNGTAYMAMGYYEGTTLRELVKTAPGYTSEAALKALLVPLLDAVELLHARQIFHRDIALDNIIVQPDGAPVLLDFGAARRIIGDMTQALTVVLKPGYAPIEQYVDEGGLKQGPWTDVYGFAALLYAAVTGKPPPMAVGRAINDSLVPLQQLAPAGYSQPFLRAIDAALAVLPEARTQSIAAFRQMLGVPRLKENAQAPTPASPPAAAPEPAPAPAAREQSTGSPWSRRPAQIGALAVAIVLVAGIALGVFRGRSDQGSVATPPSSPDTAAKTDANTALATAPAASGAREAPTANVPPGPALPPSARPKAQAEVASRPQPVPSSTEVAAGLPGGNQARVAAPPPAGADIPPPKPATAANATPASVTPKDAQEQFALGKDYEFGRGVAKNPAEAARLYRRSADQGNALAQAALGSAYRTGTGVPKNPAEAAKWTRRAAEQGMAAAQEDLGDMVLNGIGVPKDEREAARWYRLAADQGLARAQLNLGLLYKDGVGVAADDAEAMLWFRRAAAQGNEAAKAAITRLASSAPSSTPTRNSPMPATRESATATAPAGVTDPVEMTKIGRDYELGRGVRKDVAEAARWYRKGAEAGYAPAMNGLGYAYEQGWGMPQDDAEATKWYRKAAELGDPAAENNLGNTYRNARGVARNDVTAASWYRKAAEHGNAWGQTNLGFMYENGRGVFRDPVEAVKWYRQAAEKGNQQAQFSLGRMYESGTGVNKDLTAAASWFRKSADQGNAQATARLAALSGK
jgi:TPR repeat protein/serine/threonine protein kinase